jgi:uncharacterized protein with HEPN domain
MLLVAIAEHFNKLDKHRSTIIDKFDTMDIKGMISIRNFIAHDYDGVNLSVIEDSLRYDIPRIFTIVETIMEDNELG